MNKQITKEDLKDAVVSALEPFAVAMQKDFQALNNSVTEQIRGIDVRMEQADKKWDLVSEQYEGINKGQEILARDVAIVKENTEELKDLDRRFSLLEKRR